MFRLGPMFVLSDEYFLWTGVLSAKRAVNFPENLLGKRIVKEGRRRVDCEDKIRIFCSKNASEGGILPLPEVCRDADFIGDNVLTGIFQTMRPKK